MAKFRVTINDPYTASDEETIKADEIGYDVEAHAYTFWKGDKLVAIILEQRIQSIVRQ